MPVHVRRHIRKKNFTVRVKMYEPDGRLFDKFQLESVIASSRSQARRIARKEASGTAQRLGLKTTTKVVKEGMEA